jgi:hypothetical protein
MQRALLIFLVGCSTHASNTAPAPDASPAPSVACGQLDEASCNAESACYALYSTDGETLPPAGGAFVSCANGQPTCRLSTGSSTGGCDYGGVSCPQGMAIAFSVTDGDCTKGFSIAGCVHTTACP